MQWPQIVMVAWFAYSLASSVRTLAKDRDMSSSEVTAATFVVMGIQAFFAYVLHAGGFW